MTIRQSCPAVLGLVCTLGCGGPAVARFMTYPRGSLIAESDRASGGGRQVGCLDVHTERVSDQAARSGSVTIAFSIGNRCAHALEVTLQRVRVTQRAADGHEWALRRYDPASEMRLRTLDGRSQGRELIEYDASGREGSNPILTCVDLTHSLADEPTHSAVPVCFTHPGAAIEQHEVIGHQGSPAFGSLWHAPAFYLFSELSASERTIGLGDQIFSGNGAGGRRFELRGLNRVTTFGVVDHVNLRFSGPLYGGALLRVGGGHLGPRAPFVVGTAVATTGSTVEEIGAGVAIGVLSRPLGDVRVRADLALGESVILVDVNLPNCQNPCGSAGAGRTWLEPRLVLDAWLTPWWTVSAWGAADLLHTPDLAIGLTLGFHVRSFDGFP